LRFENWTLVARNSSSLYSPKKDWNIEPKVTDWAFAVCVAGANIIAREVKNEKLRY
jgi:hypothetical protein